MANFYGNPSKCVDRIEKYDAGVALRLIFAPYGRWSPQSHLDVGKCTARTAHTHTNQYTCRVCQLTFPTKEMRKQRQQQQQQHWIANSNTAMKCTTDLKRAVWVSYNCKITICARARTVYASTRTLAVRSSQRKRHIQNGTISFFLQAFLFAPMGNVDGWFSIWT